MTITTIPFSDPKQLEAFCLPIIRGQRHAATAAELMSARYVAYTLGEVDFIVQSHDPATRDEADPEAIAKWSKEADWQGLEILNTTAGGEQDNEGEVEFIARFVTGGREVKHHERSTFERKDGRWYFIDAKEIQNPIRRETPKIGRNDACHCGSGKKFKKCHGAR
jgi:SEC-C motif domain protein